MLQFVLRDRQFCRYPGNKMRRGETDAKEVEHRTDVTKRCTARVKYYKIYKLRKTLIPDESGFGFFLGGGLHLRSRNLIRHCLQNLPIIIIIIIFS